jgi:hypothetical protein
MRLDLITRLIQLEDNINKAIHNLWRAWSLLILKIDISDVEQKLNK